MNSKIKIDTFSFQKYGFFEGENRNKSETFHFCRFGTRGFVQKDSRRLINVGNFSIDDEKLGPVYEVKIRTKWENFKCRRKRAIPRSRYECNSRD